MAWDDTQTATDSITYTEWNAMVTYVKNPDEATSYSIDIASSPILTVAATGITVDGTITVGSYTLTIDATSSVTDFLQDITAESLGDLSNVTEDSPADNDVLQYVTDHWENQTLAEAGIVAVALADISGASWVIDEDTMASDLDTKVPTQQSVKAYADLMLPLAGGTLTGDLTMSGGDVVLGTQSVGYNNAGGLTFDSNNDGALSGDLSFEGNANFTLFNDSGTHKLQFDTNDWIGFTTATDVLYGYIGSVKSLQIGGSSVDYSNFAGFSAGAANTGSRSNGFGSYSLYTNTGSNSNGFGYASLQNNTGSASNGFGYASLQNNTGSASNGFGYASLQNNTGSSSNGFGTNSLLNNTGSSSNGFGTNSLLNNTGNYSNGFGYYSLLNNTGSSSNGFGHASLQNNTGNYSNGFGYYSLLNNTGSSSNGFGHASLLNNTGSSSNGFGYYSLIYNEGAYNTAIGNETFNTFSEDSGNALTIESVDHANNRVTITGHGLGAAGTIRLFKASTTSALPTGLSTTPHKWKVIDANTIECVTDSFTDAGTGTHTLTPQYIYTNSTALGNNAEPTASNQVMLGDANVTEVKSAGKGSFAGADLNDNPLQNLKRYRQSAEPSLSTNGDMAIWSDSDDDTVYLLYKDADAGQVKIQFT